MALRRTHTNLSIAQRPPRHWLRTCLCPHSPAMPCLPRCAP